MVHSVWTGNHCERTVSDAPSSDPGAYEIRGDGAVSGECAAGDGRVEEGAEYVVRYHPTLRGGIFHQRCAPTGAGWYDPTDQGEGAEDV